MIAGPSIEALPRADRDAIAMLWQERAESEGAVHSVFDALVAELTETGAHPEVLALARRAVSDELRHAAICAELADTYRGTRVPPAKRRAVRLPDYVEDRALRAALHAVNLCCIGETIATAFVEACLDECAGVTLREIHARHLADEVRHARVGWAHVASLSPETRAAIASWLPEILRAQLLAWESRLAELPASGFPGHGYPPRAQLVAVVRGAVQDLVLPGFEHVNVDTSAAARWLATHLDGVVSP